MLNRFFAVFLLAFSLFHLSLPAQEICNNAIDDDLDGLIDLNDTSDCICGQSGIKPRQFFYLSERHGKYLQEQPVFVISGRQPCSELPMVF